MILTGRVKSNRRVTQPGRVSDGAGTAALKLK